LCRTLEGHAHWVNTLALNVDYALRTGPFQLGSTANKTDSPLEYARKQYESVGEERLVSGSDDFTLFLWKPEKEKKSIGTLCCLKIQLIQLIVRNIVKIFFSKNDRSPTIDQRC